MLSAAIVAKAAPNDSAFLTAIAAHAANATRWAKVIDTARVKAEQLPPQSASLTIRR